MPISTLARGPAPNCPECGHVGLTLAALPATGEMVCLPCYRSITGQNPLPSAIVTLEGYFALKSGHASPGMGPDVCITPSWPGGSPLPIPYPSQLAQTAATKQGAPSSSGAPVVTKGPTASSQGDQPGTAFGIASSRMKGQVTFTVGWNRVTVEGSRVVRALDPTFHNRRS